MLLQRRNIARLLFFLLAIITCTLFGYFISEAILYQEHIQAAEHIELAVYQTCNMEIVVEPDSITLYDVAYWRSVERRSDSSTATQEVLIICFIENDDQWQCNCEDR